MSFAKRVLLVLHSILSLAALAALIFYEKVQMLLEKANAALGTNLTFIISIALIVIYVLTTIGVLVIAFSRSKSSRDRGFVTVDSSDGGATRVSVTAIDQMIKQAANTVDGIAEMKVFISPNDDNVDLRANVAIENGSHVPTVTMNLQNAIRKYIEVNCGVAVRKISVNIVAMQNAAESSAKKKKAEPLRSSRRNRREEAAVPEALETAVPDSEYEEAGLDVSDTEQVFPKIPEQQEPIQDDLPELVTPKLELTPSGTANDDMKDDVEHAGVQGEAVSDFARRFVHSEEASYSDEEPEADE